MLVKLGVSTMADICFGTARETHKRGWLNKSLLLKGKKEKKEKREQSNKYGKNRGADIAEQHLAWKSFSQGKV